MKISASLEQNKKQAYEIFPVGKSFDLITRDLYLGKSRAWFLGINGMCKTEVLQEIFSDLQNPIFTKNESIQSISLYMASKIGYAQAELTDDWDVIVTSVLSGPSILFVDGFDHAILLDTRTYPARSISERRQNGSLWAPETVLWKPCSSTPISSGAESGIHA